MVKRNRRAATDLVPGRSPVRRTGVLACTFSGLLIGTLLALAGTDEPETPGRSAARPAIAEPSAETGVRESDAAPHTATAPRFESRPQAPAANVGWSRHPRAASEWQGMQVNTRFQAICDGKASCGLAAACLDQRCQACTDDWQCAEGEACALDHCVPAANVRCRAAADCRTGELCVLSGYSSDPRGNRDMRAFCRSDVGGIVDEHDVLDSESIARRDSVPAEPRPVSISELRALLSPEFPGGHEEEDGPPPADLPLRDALH